MSNDKKRLEETVSQTTRHGCQQMRGRTMNPASHFFFPTTVVRKTSCHPQITVCSVLTTIDARCEESKSFRASLAVDL